MEIVQVKVSEIKEGDDITDKSLKSIKEKLPDCDFYPDRITLKEIDLIKENLNVDEVIEIYKTIPFAPVMFIGVLITLVFRTSIIHLVLLFTKG